MCFKVVTRSFFIAAVLLMVDISYSQQSQPADIDARGNREWRRRGIMNGNLVRTIYFNHAQVANWPDQPSGEWPKGSGHSYLDGVASWVAAEVVDVNGRTIHPLETNYREFIDKDPVTGLEWGWQPLPNYLNPDQESPARSDKPETWPNIWPDKPEFSGFWNGFFGKGVQNADLETYFVMDDDADKEFQFFPNSTDSTRGGLGLRVAVRGFQWSNVLAEDVIFWLLDVTNLATMDYPKTLFGFYMDTGVGGTGDSADDFGSHDTELDITFAFDGDNFGSPGNWTPVGSVGYAFLESPGNPFDGIDNDNDGLVDERRDDGIDNDGDWRPFTDSNNNDKWDLGEPLNDDLGADGSGPLDINYPGPDEGQGDGVPTPGEPNFDQTDLDESDQIGLTSVSVYILHEVDLEDDEEMWQRMAFGEFDPEQGNTNLGIIFASGPFPLRVGITERFSMAMLFGEDREDLLRTKETVQAIFNADYNFARPPLKPTVKAVAGNNKVTLYWDTIAEKSFDRFLQKLDFEGYNIYRTTDPNFLEARVITNSFGIKTFRKPIAQFDLKDGIEGPHPIAIDGIQFNMGTDNGLVHTFVDSGQTFVGPVINGQTYFYAVVPYDQGDPGLGGGPAPGDKPTGLAPTEATTIVELDLAGNLSLDINTVVVTPNAPAAGYNPPEIVSFDHTEGPATGDVWVEIIDPLLVRDANQYQIIFDDTSQGKTTFSVFDVTGNTLLLAGADDVAGTDFNPIFDGIRVFAKEDPITIVESLSGWQEGSQSTFEYRLNLFFQGTPFAADYEIRFSEIGVDTSTNNIPTNFTVWNVTDDRKTNFEFRDGDRNNRWTANDFIAIREVIDGVETRTWQITLIVPRDSEIPRIEPQPGDVFLFITTKPFRLGDVYELETKAAFVDKAQATNELDDIGVVPNPYIAAASFEPRNLFREGRGERRISFIHLPPRCTIRIFTVTGFLVDTIEHDSAVNDGAETWDLVSKDGMDIAYGLYIYHVDAPGIGQKIGKFAVVK